MGARPGATVGRGDGPRLGFTQTGAGRDVILIHGALVTREDMVLALSSALEDEFRVTAFDRPGHGESARGVATGTPWRQAAVVHETAIQLGLERPIIVGHSYGGAVALAYALQYPQHVAGVVALAPIAFPELRLEHLVFGPRGMWPLRLALNPVLATFVDPLLLPVLWRSMFVPQAVPSRYAAVFPYAAAGSPRQTEAEGEDALLLNAGLMRSAINYSGCDVPVRVFGGDRDLVVNNALQGRLVAGVLPNGRYQTLPGLGHMIHHFAQAPIVQAVRDLAGAG